MTVRVKPWPKPALTARKSAPVSPTVVDMILMIQNDSVTWDFVEPVACSDRGQIVHGVFLRSKRDCSQSDPADLAHP
jgi:hypothetical protein